MITKSGQVDWRAMQVAGEAMESFGVAGIDRGVIVNAETVELEWRQDKSKSMRCSEMRSRSRRNRRSLCRKASDATVR